MGIDVFPGSADTTLIPAPIDPDYQKTCIKKALVNSIFYGINHFCIVSLFLFFMTLFISSIKYGFNDIDGIAIIGFSSIVIGGSIFNGSAITLLRNQFLILNIKGLITKREAKRICFKLSITIASILIIFNGFIIRNFLKPSDILGVLSLIGMIILFGYISTFSLALVYDAEWNRVKLEIKNSPDKQKKLSKTIFFS